MKKYPKIFALGKEETEGLLDGELVLQEKIDGGNFRFMFKDGEVIFGSRTQEFESDDVEQWKRVINYLKTQVKDKKKKEGVIFFGEAILRHTLNYDFDKMPAFLGFDVWHIKKEEFLPYKKVLKLFKQYDIELCPFIKQGIWNKDLSEKDLEIPRSKYVDNWAEGIMIKNYKKQIFGKVVSDKFKEENRRVFGGGKKHAKDDAEYFTLVYATNSRIDKAVFKEIDSGAKLEMKLMSVIPKIVYADIWEENWREISKSNRSIDMKRFRKLVTNRCLNVLKQMITNQNLK